MATNVDPRSHPPITLRTFTVAEFRGWNPCWTTLKLNAYLNKFEDEPWTVFDVYELPDKEVSPDDKWWVIEQMIELMLDDSYASGEFWCQVSDKLIAMQDEAISLSDPYPNRMDAAVAYLRTRLHPEEAYYKSITPAFSLLKFSDSVQCVALFEDNEIAESLEALLRVPQSTSKLSQWERTFCADVACNVVGAIDEGRERKMTNKQRRRAEVIICNVRDRVERTSRDARFGITWER